MADKPIYYGSSKSSPIYYGASTPIYGSSKTPVYYGASRQYGQYGSYGAYGGVGGPNNDKSIVGTLTLNRILRVISQRWLTIFVFLLVGIIISFSIYSVSPKIYEAVSEFTIDINSKSGNNSSVIENDNAIYGNNYAENFNTRQSQWRSREVFDKVIEEYNRENKDSNAKNDLLYEVLGGSKLDLVRNSRIITISVRSQDPKMAMELANAYLRVIKAKAREEDDKKIAEALRELKEEASKRREEWDKKKEELLATRMTNQVDRLTSERDTLQQSIQQLTTTIADLESKVSILEEWEKLLVEVKNDPSSFGRLSTSVPRAPEIKTEYDLWQKAASEQATLQDIFTEEADDVKKKVKEVSAAKQRFIEAVNRAYEASKTELGSTRNRLRFDQEKRKKNQDDLARLSEKIAEVDSKIDALDQEVKRYNESFGEAEKMLIKGMQEASAGKEYIRENRAAVEPTVPVSPNTLIIFGAGIVLALMLGIVFVLMLDNFEDTIVNLSDIEGRLSLKVLAVLPHVQRKKRESVAKFVLEDKYSHFSETVAGLRNLLDSPRYETMSRCVLVISTQPGEGKTITSMSLAISHAQTGRKVLHVDFDLRRPRVAKIWDLELTEERSFSHCLQKAGAGAVDFSKLVNKTKVEGLDIICSLPPDGVAPTTIFGSSIVSEFFTWARENYDRIIIDSPPFGVVGDVVSLAALVDSTIVMCCPDRTHFKPIQYCARTLTESGANILGVVVNDVELTGSSAFNLGTHRSYGYRYGYGYGYGYGYRPRDTAKKVGDGDNPERESEKKAKVEKPGVSEREDEENGGDNRFADED